MKALLERKKLCADLLAFAAQQPGMGARQLQRTLPRLGAGVGKEHAVEPRAFCQAQRELGLSLVVEEVRRMNQRAALRCDRFFDRRVA